LSRSSRSRTGGAFVAAALGAAVLAAAVGPVDAAPTVSRVAGGDRFATASALSAGTFVPGVPTAVLASGDAFPDALAAAPVAEAGSGPVLLTRQASLPDSTAAELDRLNPARILIAGGPEAVSPAVQEAARRYSNQIVRIAGSDRFATAAGLSSNTFSPGVAVAFVANGGGFADALAAGSVAAALGGPVLLATRDTLPSITATELDRLNPARILVLGGFDVISPAVEEATRRYSDVTGRVAGPDRFGTAAAVADLMTSRGDTVYLASGRGFADALAAGAVGGRTRSPVLLVEPSCVPDPTAATITRYNPARLIILGGTQAVSPDVETLMPCPNLAQARVALTRLATLSQPLALATRAGDAGLYVAEKGGRVRRVGDATTTVLDLSGQVSTGPEQGLLGIAFSQNGTRLYVSYTDRNGDSRIVEYAMAGNAATPGSARLLLTVDQPFSNHNGGQVTIGPDGMLYIGFGDGGSANDPQDNGQRLDTLLGKLLRIDPTPSGSSAYRIPPDNPFVGHAGARAEIWTWGLRNPWRFSFDRASGDLWIGDVGQSGVEEVDYRAAGTAAGANFGWARLEGTRPVRGTPPPGAVPPLLEYETGPGGTCAVTGGYVYRGARIPRLRGAYVYADFCVGDVKAVVQSGGAVVASRDLAVSAANLSSFGEDQAGELYAFSLDGDVFRLDPAP
jgi:putative cell wall-binding protein/glucose/arabinose dehydrogenase